jgi:hypothetical protein
LQPGEYIGNLTFKSKFDRNENTSIQVRFIVIESPLERAPFVSNPAAPVPFGIKLTVTPFNGFRPDLTRTLIMGSSPLATDYVDSLCGEYPREQPLLFGRFGDTLIFDARFFLDPAIYPNTTPPSIPS